MRNGKRRPMPVGYELLPPLVKFTPRNAEKMRERKEAWNAIMLICERAHYDYCYRGDKSGAYGFDGNYR